MNNSFGFNYDAAYEAAAEAEEGNYDGDAEPDQDNFMFFETPSGNTGASNRSKSRKRRRSNYEPYGDDEQDERKRAAAKPVYEYVDMETMRRKSRMKQIRSQLAPMPPPPLDTTSESTGGGGGGDGRGGGRPNSLLHAEIEAAAVAETDMWDSSCSEDEEVLMYELNDYGIRLSGGFEEDRRNRHGSGCAHRSEDLPQNARLFEEERTQTGFSESHAHEQHAESQDDEYSAAAEDQQGKRERVKMMRMQLRKVKRERGVVADVCVKCMYGNERFDGVYAQPLHEVFKFLEQQIGTGNFRAAARSTHLMYKHRVYLPFRKAGRYVPMWRTRTIYEHIMRHEMEPRVQLGRQIQLLNKLADILADETHMKDKETGEVKANVPVVRALLDTVKTAHQLQLTDPKKMVFYNDKSEVQLGATASSSNKKPAQRGRFILKPSAPPT